MLPAASYYQLPSYGWSAVGYFKSTNASADLYIKVFSHHNLPQSALSASQPPPNLEYLMSHVDVTSNVDQYKDDVAVANARGFDYVFGETNYVSGNGKPGHGVTFGTGLWMLDNALQSAAVNIKCNYFHQGTLGNPYYVWFNQAGFLSPFYGGYLAADALAGGAKIGSLDGGTTNYAGYVLYNSASDANKVMLIHTNSFDGSGTRPTQEFTLQGFAGSQQQDLGEDPTYAGQSVGNTICQLSGTAVDETALISDGKAAFTLAASDALVVAL
ncbi:hypothetical protein F5883DRAFT_639996 [Diaporthe sp. PMI_573]|nr:hypothetical protein F5883DRAFT_639996 [Diaporthaceae sp. PMI_573]